MARELRDFLNLHHGETAWIFGKGPSLDRWFEDPDSDRMPAKGEFRCAINDAVSRVAGCSYGFANDSVAPWLHVYDPSHVVFQPLRIRHDMHAVQVDLPCERVWFSDDWEPDRLSWERERCAIDGLCVRPGTLGSAAQVLRVMGVARIVCVGIDGGGVHASGPWNTRLRADHARDYNEIRQAFLEWSRLTGTEVSFYGRQPDQPDHDMKTIRITEATFENGKPLFVGQVIELPTHRADMLLQMGRAVIHQLEPMESRATPRPPEAATLAPSIEHADAARQPGRRRKVGP